MKVRILRGTLHLGYAYRPGEANPPDDIAKILIAAKLAVPIAEKRPEPTVVTAEVKATETTKEVVKRTYKKK